jgi:hypothetical protein
MCAQQRKAVGMLAHTLLGRSPSSHGVTTLAVCSHLSAMNIGVAVGAVLPYFAEHQIRMALNTTNLLVPAAQRVTSFVVVKLR